MKLFPQKCILSGIFAKSNNFFPFHTYFNVINNSLPVHSRCCQISYFMARIVGAYICGSQFFSSILIIFFHIDCPNSNLEFFCYRYQFFPPILTSSFSRLFSQLPNFFIHTTFVENFKVGRLFLKNWFLEKNFGQNIITKILLIRKLVQKVTIRGPVLSQKIRFKKFSIIFQCEEFQREIFLLKILCFNILNWKIGVKNWS